VAIYLLICVEIASQSLAMTGAKSPFPKEERWRCGFTRNDRRKEFISEGRAMALWIYS
jgi:hypothetical protein